MLNNITIMGRLTKNPELRRTNNGIAVATATVAVNRDYDREKTDFLDIVAWRGTGEFLAKNFAKGRAICVNGRLETRQWSDKSGNNRTSYEIIAENVYFADSKPAGVSPAATDYVPDAVTDYASDDDELPF